MNLLIVDHNHNACDFPENLHIRHELYLANVRNDIELFSMLRLPEGAENDGFSLKQTCFRLFVLNVHPSNEAQVNVYRL